MPGRWRGGGTAAETQTAAASSTAIPELRPRPCHKPRRAARRDPLRRGVGGHLGAPPTTTQMGSRKCSEHSISGLLTGSPTKARSRFPPCGSSASLGAGRGQTGRPARRKDAAAQRKPLLPRRRPAHLHARAHAVSPHVRNGPVFQHLPHGGLRPGDHARARDLPPRELYPGAAACHRSGAKRVCEVAAGMG